MSGSVNRAPFEVTLNGTTYRAEAAQYRRATVSPVRPQVDQGERTGEGSVAQTGLWRTPQRDWSGGAGQRTYDLPDSREDRYWSSVGVNPFFPGRLGQFQELSSRASTTTGTVVYTEIFSKLFDRGSSLVWALDEQLHVSGSDYLSLTLPTTFTLTRKIVAATTDGSTVWYVYESPGGGGSLTSGGTQADWGGGTDGGAGVWEMIDYAGGRLIAGNNAGLLVELSTAAAKTDLYTHPRAGSFRWRGCVAGPDGLYAYGAVERNDGRVTQTEVYLLTVNASTGALEKPTQVATIPGECVLCAAWIGDVMFLGSDRGFRVATPSAGGLVYGPLVRFNTYKQNVVQCCAVDGRHVVFGWGPMVGSPEGSPVAWGVGRADLSKMTRPLVPAYCAAEGISLADNASFVGAYGPPSSVVVVNGYPFVTAGFAYASGGDYVYPPGGSGGRNPTPATAAASTFHIFGPSNDRKLMSPAYLTTSRYTFGLGDSKVLTHVSVGTEALTAGELAIEVDRDEGSYTTSGYVNTVGSRGSNGPVLLPLAQRAPAAAHKVRLKFTRGTTAVNWGPVVTNLAVYSAPVVPRVEQITVPLLVGTDVATRNGATDTMSPFDTFTALKALEAAGTLVDYVEGDQAAIKVRVEGVELSDVAFNDRAGWWQGKVLVQLVSVDQLSTGATLAATSSPIAGSASDTIPLPAPGGGVDGA